MSRRTDKTPPPLPDEAFLSRWSHRKLQPSREAGEVPDAAGGSSPDHSPDTRMPTDADMPPLETLTEDSDYSGFLSPRVSEALRKQALRKLFHSPGFNVRDGLDDYDGEYTQFAKLGGTVTADMRHQIENASRRAAAQQAAHAGPEQPAAARADAVPAAGGADDTAVADARNETDIDEDQETEL